MNYQFKRGIGSIFRIDANTAGNELNRLYMRDGEITPRQVVQEARPHEAPLHPAFEWRDKIAAEKYREHQARKLIAAVVEVVEPPEEAPKPVHVETRAYEHVRGVYHPIEVIVSDRDMKAELLEKAEADMADFKSKYKTLTELSGVFKAIEDYRGEVKHHDEAEQQAPD